MMHIAGRHTPFLPAEPLSLLFLGRCVSAVGSFNSLGNVLGRRGRRSPPDWAIGGSEGPANSDRCPAMPRSPSLTVAMARRRRMARLPILAVPLCSAPFTPPSGPARSEMNRFESNRDGVRDCSVAREGDAFLSPHWLDGNGDYAVYTRASFCPTSLLVFGQFPTRVLPGRVTLLEHPR